MGLFRTNMKKNLEQVSQGNIARNATCMPIVTFTSRAFWRGG